MLWIWLQGFISSVDNKNGNVYKNISDIQIDDCTSSVKGQEQNKELFWPQYQP